MDWIGLKAELNVNSRPMRMSLWRGVGAMVVRCVCSKLRQEKEVTPMSNR